MAPLALAASLAAAVAALAWAARTLTMGGAVAAWMVGTAVVWGAGWPGGAVLAAFFVSSNLVSRLVPAPLSPLDAKGDRRDACQVLANGAAAALGALAGRYDPTLGLWLATAGLAAAGADTWATSLGALSRTLPRFILNGQPVAPGTSGGVSLVGTVGGAVGATLIALTGAATGADPWLGIGAAMIGVGGMLADSVLGAAVQGRFWCPACDVPSEWNRHRCGTRTLARGGWSWLTNDGVNALATALAVLAGWGAWALVWR